jgi:VanZ family protein
VIYGEIYTFILHLSPMFKLSMTLTHKIIFRLPALLIAGAIWFLSSQSILPQPKGILGFDKLQHLAAYLVFTGAIGLWVSPEFWQSRRFRALLLAVLIGSAYGVVDEIHQYFVPGRDCNVWDWVADTLGAILGAAAVMLINTWFLKKTSNPAAGQRKSAAVEVPPVTGQA